MPSIRRLLVMLGYGSFAGIGAVATHLAVWHGFATGVLAALIAIWWDREANAKA